jgi:hypothetical protein
VVAVVHDFNMMVAHRFSFISLLIYSQFYIYSAVALADVGVVNVAMSDVGVATCVVIHVMKEDVVDDGYLFPTINHHILLRMMNNNGTCSMIRCKGLFKVATFSSFICTYSRTQIVDTSRSPIDNVVPHVRADNVPMNVRQGDYEEVCSHSPSITRLLHRVNC